MAYVHRFPPVRRPGARLAARETFEWRRGDYWFPDVRTVGGAVAMFMFVTLSMFTIARTAFLERAGGVLEGRGRAWPWGSFFRVSLPLGSSGGGWRSRRADGDPADYGTGPISASRPSPPASISVVLARQPHRGSAVVSRAVGLRGPGYSLSACRADGHFNNTSRQVAMPLQFAPATRWLGLQRLLPVSSCPVARHLLPDGLLLRMVFLEGAMRVRRALRQAGAEQLRARRDHRGDRCVARRPARLCRTPGALALQPQVLNPHRRFGLCGPRLGDRGWAC